METNYLQDVTFKTIDSSFPSSVDNGLRAPFVGLFVGQPGQGKSFAMSQYCKQHLAKFDYDGLFALCSEYIANAQYFDHISPILDAFPEEYVYDKEKVFAWLDHLSKWNRERMQYWRDVHKKYPEWKTFKHSKEDFNEFIKKREEKFIPLNVEAIEAPKKKTKTKKTNNVDVPQPVISTETSLDKLNLDYNPWRNAIKIKNTPAVIENITEEIMKKVKRYYIRPPLCILYADDLLNTPMMDNSKSNKLINKCINLRHDGFTFLFGVHRFVNGCPKTIRTNARVFCIYPTADETELKGFYNEVMSATCSFKDFKEFFFNVIDGTKHKFLLIDRISNPMELRINWNIIGNAKEMIQKWLYYIRLPKHNLESNEIQSLKPILKRKLKFGDGDCTIKRLKK